MKSSENNAKSTRGNKNSAAIKLSAGMNKAFDSAANMEKRVTNGGYNKCRPGRKRRKQNGGKNKNTAKCGGRKFSLFVTKSAYYHLETKGDEIIKNEADCGFVSKGFFRKKSEKNPEAEIVHRKMGKGICGKRKNFHRKDLLSYIKTQNFGKCF